MDATISPSIKEQYGALLVAEEHSVCPNDGCSTPLFVNVGGQLGANYEVTFIDPSVCLLYNLEISEVESIIMIFGQKMTPEQI